MASVFVGPDGSPGVCFSFAPSALVWIVSDRSVSVLVMEQNLNNPENRDDRDWLRQMDALGVDAAAEMERSLTAPEGDAPLPEWAE